MAEQLKAFVLAKDLSVLFPVPTWRFTNHSLLQFLGISCPLLASVGTNHECTYIHVGKILICIK